MDSPTLVFDIETIPDVSGYRRIENLPSSSQLPDAEVAEMMAHAARVRHGHDFLPLPLQRVVAIAYVWRTDDKWGVGSVGKVGDSEESLIRHFFNVVEEHSPQLVSWNGGGFDLPVLNYRSMIYGVDAPLYWELDNAPPGPGTRWNNYQNRYHTCHLDLMDVLSRYQMGTRTSLDTLSRLCYFPGKLPGQSGSNVWQWFQDDRWADIRSYCETDVVNTWLLYLRFELIRGKVSKTEYDKELLRTRQSLMAIDAPHWTEYLNAWKAGEEAQEAVA